MLQGRSQRLMDTDKQYMCLYVTPLKSIYRDRQPSPPLAWCSPVQQTPPDTQLIQNNNSSVPVAFLTRILLNANNWRKRMHSINLDKHTIKAKSWDTGDLVSSSLATQATVSKLFYLPVRTLEMTAGLPVHRQPHNLIEYYLQAAWSLHCCNGHVKNSLK